MNNEPEVYTVSNSNRGAGWIAYVVAIAYLVGLSLLVAFVYWLVQQLEM